jgi:SpoIIAA-like
MSIDYSIDDKLVIVSVHGFNTFEDVANVFVDIIADPAFNPSKNILFDARDTDYGPPTEELEALAGHIGKLKTHFQGRWAVVADSNSLVYGMSRMFSYLAEQQGMRIESFSDYNEARAWLLHPKSLSWIYEKPRSMDRYLRFQRP